MLFVVLGDIHLGIIAISSEFRQNVLNIKLQIDMNKFKIVVCIFGLLMLFTLSVNAQSIPDYGIAKCKVVNSRQCPAGSRPGAGFGASTTCLSNSSNFCELLTGNSSWFSYGDLGGAYNYCTSPITRSVGSCVRGGDNKDYLEINDLSVIDTLQRYLILSDGSRIAEITVGNQPEVNVEALRFEYFSSFETGRGEALIMSDRLFCNSENKPFIPAFSSLMAYFGPDDTMIAEQFNTILKAGFGLERTIAAGTAEERVNFCANPSDVFIRNENKCITGLAESGKMRPCYISYIGKDDIGNTYNSGCIVGTNNSFRQKLAGNKVLNIYQDFVDINTQNAFSVVGLPPGNLNHEFEPYNNSDNTDENNFPVYISASPDPAKDRVTSICNRNAKEVLQLKGNIGCAEFMSYDPSTNSISVNQDKYESCTSCIYGDSPSKITPIGTKLELRLDDGTVISVNDDSIVGLTKDTEPFYKLIPGRVYNDLGGCVNTADAAGVINTIVRLSLGIMGGLVILRIIQGAVTMQRGDPEGFQEGREIIVSALVGLLVLILSAAILNFLGINILQLNQDNSGFNQFGGS